MTRSLGLMLFVVMATTTVALVLGTWLFAADDADLDQVLLTAGVVGVGLCAVLAWFFARWIGEPLEEMERVAKRLAGGRLEGRVRSERKDALGSLGRAIDDMADQLAERIERVNAETARLRTIVDAMVEAVVVTDDKGTIVMTNAALVALVGRDPVGHTVIEALRSPELGEAVQRASGRQGTAESGRVAFELRTARGDRSLSAQIAALPKSAGVITVIHDVTDVRRADSVRRDFAANASHELRTPLTSIRGFAETLLDGAIEQPDVGRRFAQNIVDNAVRLQRLVDDLLELSRAESPDVELELEPVSAIEIATKVVRSLEGRASDKGTEVTVKGDAATAWCLAEPRALDHVLMNLVENAIKYSPPKAHVAVLVDADAEHVRIRVKDDGPGIAPHHVGRIFERFYRVDPGRSREQGGTGLGLSIVKHLATRMEGDVTVESRLGVGTTFTVTLARPRVSLTDWSDEQSL
jgi:two-component system phosphate regulon sensor histidine kinase PhoR